MHMKYHPALSPPKGSLFRPMKAQDFCAWAHSLWGSSEVADSKAAHTLCKVHAAAPRTDAKGELGTGMGDGFQVPAWCWTAKVLR